MSATPHGPTYTAITAASNYTNETFNLDSTTVGDLNVIAIGGTVTGTGNTMEAALAVVQAGTGPTPWTIAKVQTDTNGGTGSSGSWLAVIWKVREAGDTGTTVQVTWTGRTGQATPVAWSVPSGQFDPADPVPMAVATELGSAATNQYTTSGTTPAGKNGILYWFATNRSDATAWASSSGGTLLGKNQVGAAASANSSLVVRYDPADVAGGTAFTKTHTGASTSIGMAGAILIKNAPSGGGTITGSGAATAQAATATGTGSVAATPLSNYLSATPFYCAHRGGSGDWPESSAYAYSQSAAWSPTLALEASCWRTSDGVWVLSHDQTTGRMFGTNLDIPTSTWAQISPLRTTVGGYPMMRLDDFLTLYGTTRILFVDNKSGNNNSEFLDMIDAAGGPSRHVIKMFNTATSLAVAARARGYKTWGYYYEADATGTPTSIMDGTASNYDILGMDYLANQAAWTEALSFGKPVMAHILPNAASKTTSLNYGASGMMVAKVSQVVPAGATPITGSGAATAAAATATGAGAARVVGSGAAIAAAATAIGAGAAPATGSGTASVPAATAGGVGQVLVRGTGAVTAGVATAAGVARAIASGSGAATLDPATAIGVAFARIFGDGAATAEPATASGVGVVEPVVVPPDDEPELLEGFSVLDTEPLGLAVLDVADGQAVLDLAGGRAELDPVALALAVLDPAAGGLATLDQHGSAAAILDPVAAGLATITQT